MNKLKLHEENVGIKRLFWKLGSCSRTYFYILNHEFGHHKENEERAADPLAGGILQTGYQCGMLWGTSLAAGAESYRRFGNSARAMASAITATQYLIKSFVARTNSPNCLDVTNCDWTSKVNIAKYFITGKFLTCFKLAEKWAPEAVQAAADGLAIEQADLPQQNISCAAKVAEKMGASDEETIMVAGFAGGLGLSGNACGALAAAIWLNSLDWCRENPGKSSISDAKAMSLLESFYGASDYEMLCSKITGKTFDTIADHADYIETGGCEKLISVLAQK